MVIRLITILTIMLVAVVVSHDALPSEVYWQTVFPNSRMPKALQDRLTPDLEEENTGKPGGRKGKLATGGVYSRLDLIKNGYTRPDSIKSGHKTGYTRPASIKSSYKTGYTRPDSIKSGYKTRYTRPDSIKTGYKTGYTRPDSIKTGYARPDSIKTGYKSGYTRPDSIKTGYTKNYTSASEDQLTDDPNVALFFLENDLHPGAKMNLHFTKTTNGATFLPRQIANAIPFSSNKLAKIYQGLSVEPKSDEAMSMKQTVEMCETPAEEGEEKYCATSLESMIDFSTSKLGPNVKVIGTEVDKEDTHKQQYRISGRITKMVVDNSVVCHGLTYAYAVFYCHVIHSTRVYVVPLVGDDGTKVKAAAVCHTDTSIKPGVVPICHFIHEDNIVWVPK